MDLVTVLKLGVVTQVILALTWATVLVVYLCQLIKDTHWYWRRQRKQHLRGLYDVVFPLAEVAQAYCNGGRQMPDLIQAANFLVVNYNQGELSDIATAIRIEQTAYPERFRNPHYVNCAMTGVFNPDHRIMISVLMDDHLDDDVKYQCAVKYTTGLLATSNRLTRERAEL